MKKILLFISAMMLSSISHALEITSTVDRLHPILGQVRFTLADHPCVGDIEFYASAFSSSSPALDSEYKAGFSVLLSALHSGNSVTIVLNTTNEVKCNAGTSNGLIWVGDIIGLSS